MKNKMEIDIREFRLGKWYIPKQISSFDKVQDGYHALGYFDIITVKTPNEGDVQNMHVWSNAYHTSYRMSDDLQSDYFIQEIKAFTNICDNHEKGFSKEEIENFWSDESLLLCMSMLHVPLDFNVSELIEDINEQFKRKDYLYYYSFDYSGVIVVAKNMNIHEYLRLMFKLTYDSKKHPKIVKDAYSVYGLQKKKVLEFLSESKDKKNTERCKIESKYLKDSHTYEVAVNLSVRNYAEYKKFKEEFDAIEKHKRYKSEVHELPGRHDISIVNKKANFYWILRVQQLLDSHSAENKTAFYSYETFVKITDGDEVGLGYDATEFENEVYEQLCDNLQDAYNNFIGLLSDEKHHSYKTPVREVCNSILSILKNAFAEDFVLCMYQAFLGFLKYLNGKLTQDSKSENVMFDKEIELCFENFFDGLSSLVNSAMHTDRQFIQATSFSAIFYDVPPKIMAFYVAMIQKICKIMSKNDNYKYTFLMKPGFCDEISVKIISFQVRDAEDRILQVAINERFLYHPHAVMRRIVHEIAHYKGDELRKRDVRKEKLIRTFIHTIFNDCLPKELEYDYCFSGLVNNVYDFFANISEFECSVENYSYQIRTKYKVILRYIIYHEELQELLRLYVKKELKELHKTGGLSKLQNIIEAEEQRKRISIVDINNIENCSEIQMEYLEKLLFEIINNNLRRLIDSEASDGRWITQHYGEILKGQSLKQYVNALVSLYSETYADVQMIQVLGISYTEYLNAFLKDENLDVESLPKNGEDISRIAVVAKLMRDNGTWKLDTQEKDGLKRLHEIVMDFIGRMECEADVYYTQNLYLQEYLIECLRESEKHYKSEVDDIDDVREKIKIIVEHEDVQEVYSTICKVLCNYREVLKSLTWETTDL